MSHEKIECSRCHETLDHILANPKSLVYISKVGTECTTVVQRYRDETGRLWSGRTCPDCVHKMAREAYARRKAAGKKRNR